MQEEMTVEEDEAIVEVHGWCVELTESVEGGASIEFRGLEEAGGRETP